MEAGSKQLEQQQSVSVGMGRKFVLMLSIIVILAFAVIYNHYRQKQIEHDVAQIQQIYTEVRQERDQLNENNRLLRNKLDTLEILKNRQTDMHQFYQQTINKLEKDNASLQKKLDNALYQYRMAMDSINNAQRNIELDSILQQRYRSRVPGNNSEN